MTRSFRIEPGRVHGEKDGVSFFDTAAYPVQYADSVLSVSGHSLVFPDFRKGNAYCWMQWDFGTSGAVQESAISLITMPNQEWGPGTTNPTDSGTQIDDVLLGTVPGGADHILVRSKLTRTVAPSQINGHTIPAMPKSGQWTLAYGGTLLVEQLWPIARLVRVYLSPTLNGDGTKNVYLRKLQSVVKQRMSFYRSGNDPTKTGWNYGGTYGSVYGIPVAQRDTKGVTVDPSGVGRRHMRTGGNPAATDDNTNYSSTYTADFEIIPGRADITPSTGSGGTSANFAFVDEASGDVNAATHSRTMQFGDAAAGRRILLAVAHTAASGTTVTGCTIGGVTATLVGTAGAQNGVRIYVATVPTGTSGTVSVTFSGSAIASTFVVYAGYNMNSSTPDAVIQSTTANGSLQPLATVAGGFALAISYSAGPYGNIEFGNVPHSNYYVQGIENQALFPVRDTTTGTIVYTRGHQTTDGATLQMKCMTFVQTCGWVAASFH